MQQQALCIVEAELTLLQLVNIDTVRGSGGGGRNQKHVKVRSIDVLCAVRHSMLIIFVKNL